jgi:poly(hydroxyalkanoate) depolymerase family esterase
MAVRASSQAIASALRSGKKKVQSGVVVGSTAKRRQAQAKPSASAGWISGWAGRRRHWLFKPGLVKATERLPLVVMLHGCGQDAQSMAIVSQMNQLATRERFLVVYPQQDRSANLHGCWNWFATRSGQAQHEADAILSVVDVIIKTQPVDTNRVVVAGFSAGAGMAALLATRHPGRFQAIAMHSGIAPGVARTQAGALAAMHGQGPPAIKLAPLAAASAGDKLPPLLVIHGSGDRVVVPQNASDAAQRWAASEGALSVSLRTVQRGARYPMTITDYSLQRRLVVKHCLVKGLGHAWSGGAAKNANSDAKGPNASRIIWAFAAGQFGGNSLDAITLVAT